MTPKAISIVSQLRREFYSLFAVAMPVEVSITPNNSSMGNLPIAYWIDDNKLLNYLRICVYTAPDDLIPERPFILRVSVNKGAGIVAPNKWRKDCQGMNQDWNFDLILLPEEILDFLPWIVNLVQSHEKGSASLVEKPPHPLEATTPISNALLLNELWTQKAWQFGSSLPNKTINNIKSG
ncbi:MAG: hypothetical protein F6K14_18440 [Symploca sp. SIO2C1]|nr:hypothetical protein [Symploca sp. SIO2C1]